MDTIFGLPAHPLLVHIPIAMLPLAAIGVVVMAMRPVWHQRYRWAVLAVGTVGTLGAVLAASAGERLEERIVAVEGADAASSWERHAQLGETARNVSLVFLVLLVVFVLVPWWLERRTAAGPSTEVETASARNLLWVRTAVAALAVLGAVGCVTTIVRAGHTGSESVWEDYVSKTGDNG
jgi:uncharacterized membrane protein